MTVTRYKEENYTQEHVLLVENIVETSIIREIVDVYEMLLPEDKQITYDQLDEYLGTNYSMNPFESPQFDAGIKEIEVKIPFVHASHVIDRHEKARRDKGEAPTSKVIMQQAGRMRRDEDMYAILGENTYNGVTSFADTTNNSTAATTELDLTSFATAWTTFNGLINQLASLLNNSGNDNQIGQEEIIFMVTSDVDQRLHELQSTLEDFRSGYDLVLALLEKRCGPGSRIVVSNNLGGTITKEGNRFTRSTDGTTNAVLFAKNTNFVFLATSPMEIIESEGPHKSYIRDQGFRSRIVFTTQSASGAVYSGTVDITA